MINFTVNSNGVDQAIYVRKCEYNWKNSKSSKFNYSYEITRRMDQHGARKEEEEKLLKRVEVQLK